MNITLNNRAEKIEVERITVQELLDLKHYTFKMLIVKINGKLIKKDHYSDTTIHDGDNVIVLHLVSGG